MTSQRPGPAAGVPLLVRGTRVLELAAVVVIGIAIAVEFVIAGRQHDAAGLASAAVVVAAVVAGWRGHLGLSLALTAAGPVVAAATGWPTIHNWSIACFGGFVLALRGLPGWLVALVLGLANLTAVGWYHQSLAPQSNTEASIAAAAAVAFAASGSALRSQQRYLAELEQRNHDALTGREAAIDRSIAQERLRIARDLHDSVGHQIAVVSMHLGAAEVHLADPEAAQTDLAAARLGVQAVLRETQDILTVLTVDHDGASLTPTPDHSRVAGLVQGFRAAGLQLEAELEGFERPLPPATSAAVFRIVQESLTNAERHGQGTIRLRAQITEPAVVIEVSNQLRGDGRDTSGGGHGLVGMRERAESAGGHLFTREDGHEFWVRAELPTRHQEDQ